MCGRTYTGDRDSRKRNGEGEGREENRERGEIDR